MLTLRNTRADVEFSKLKADSEELRQAAAVVTQKYEGKKKKKVM